MVSVQIRPAKKSDADLTVALALRSFDEFIAPDYPDEGIAHFYANVTVDGLVATINDGCIVLVATVDETLAGVAQVRDETHITWLYVDKAYHGCGIGRALVVSAAEQLRERTPAATELTLNSSPFAVPIYVRMGFQVSGPDKTKHGMRFTPMRAAIGTFIK